MLLQLYCKVRPIPTAVQIRTQRRLRLELMKRTSEGVTSERVGTSFQEEAREAPVARHQYVEERNRVRICSVDDCQLHEGGAVPLQCPSQRVILCLLAIFVTKKEFHQAVEPG